MILFLEGLSQSRQGGHRHTETSVPKSLPKPLGSYLVFPDPASPQDPIAGAPFVCASQQQESNDTKSKAIPISKSFIPSPLADITLQVNTRTASLSSFRITSSESTRRASLPALLNTSAGVRAASSQAEDGLFQRSSPSNPHHPLTLLPGRVQPQSAKHKHPPNLLLGETESCTRQSFSLPAVGRLMDGG